MIVVLTQRCDAIVFCFVLQRLEVDVSEECTGVPLSLTFHS